MLRWLVGAYVVVTLATAPSSSYTLWYEDEYFEDCGLTAMAADPHKACADTWFKATGPFETELECQTVRAEYVRQADDEFRCDVERPPKVNDDGPDSGPIPRHN